MEACTSLNFVLIVPLLFKKCNFTIYVFENIYYLVLQFLTSVNALI